MKSDSVLGKTVGLGVLSLIAAFAVRAILAKEFIMPVGLIEWSEIIGFVTGVVGVYLVIKESMWNWPVGIVNVLTYALFFAVGAKHFGAAGLQIVFLVYMIEGWWRWKFGGEKRDELPITRASKTDWLVALGTVLIGTPIMIPVLTGLNGNFVFLDALTTTISLAAQFMVNRKRIENWWLWIVADAIYVPLYAYRQYHLTAVLYIIFLVLAVVGLREWRRKLDPLIYTG
jgi:nicotinamide mononucleotide transporter